MSRTRKIVLRAVTACLSLVAGCGRSELYGPLAPASNAGPDVGQDQRPLPPDAATFPEPPPDAPAEILPDDGPVPLPTVANVSAGTTHTCVRKTDGTLWCWGWNNSGQLGNGSTTERHSPIQVTALGNDVVEVSTGIDFTCARKTDGTLWCWGSNYYGELGDGTTSDRYNPVQVTALGNGVVEVSAGDNRACARKTDGILWCWGLNAIGQLGDGTVTERHNPVQVAVLGAGVAGVSAGVEHTCARKIDGSLWCWGSNGFGQLGDGTTTDRNSPIQTALGTDVAEVSAGAWHTCARKTDDSLWCWGWNAWGQLGDGMATDGHSPVKVTSLGAVVAEVSNAGAHTCARKSDGTLWCWGLNDHGQLGDGTATARHSPVQVTVLGTDVAEVSAGQEHTCARKTDGTLWCWGRNDYGQLGDGTTADRSTPVQVRFP